MSYIFTSTNISNDLKFMENFIEKFVWNLIDENKKDFLQRLMNVWKEARQRNYKSFMLEQDYFTDEEIEIINISELFELKKENDFIYVYTSESKRKPKAKVKKEISQEAKDLATLLFTTQEKYIKIKPKLAEWSKEFDKMLENDKISYEEIEEIIKTLPKIDFWYDKILSPKNLRKHFNKLKIELSKTKKKLINKIKNDNIELPQI